MGAIYLTDEQINQIKALKIRGANAQGNYSDFIRRYLQCSLVAKLNFGWMVLRLPMPVGGGANQVIQSTADGTSRYSIH